MDKLIRMKFLTATGPYNKGDVAGFYPEKARELELKKLAEPFTDKDMAAAKKAAASDIDARVKAIEAREAELAKREAAAEEREKEAAAAASSAPPSQGAAKKPAKD